MADGDRVGRIADLDAVVAATAAAALAPGGGGRIVQVTPGRVMVKISARPPDVHTVIADRGRPGTAGVPVDFPGSQPGAPG